MAGIHGNKTDTGLNTGAGEKVVVTQKPTGEGVKTYVSTEKKTEVKRTGEKIRDTKKDKEGFLSDPENRRKAKIVGAIAAGIAAIALGGYIVNQNKDEEEVEDGLAKAQLELDHHRRHWFRKAKRSVKDGSDKAGKQLGKGKDWLGDKANQTKDAAGGAADNLKAAVDSAAQEAHHKAARFGESQKEAERRVLEKSAEKHAKAEAAAKDSLESAKSKTGKAYQKGVDAVDDRIHGHRKDVDQKNSGGCSIM